MQQAIMSLPRIVFVIMVFIAGSAASQEAGRVFEKALFLEESSGDILQAIALYDRIVREFSSEPGVAAKAQLHIGICYEKMGKSEAVKAYETVITRFPGEIAAVAAARSRLAELQKAPAAGLSVRRLSGWDTGGVFVQPVSLTADDGIMVGVEFIKGQNIVLYDMNSRELRYITDYRWNREGYRYAYNPVLSPDGGRIVYWTDTTDGTSPARYTLALTTLNDGRTRILASDDSISYIPEAWLPDGSAILMIRVSPAGAYLGLFDPQQRTYRILVPLRSRSVQAGRHDNLSSVSPDGRFVLYCDSAPDKEDNDIYIISTGGDTARPFIRHPAAKRYPRWSPDGRYMVFESMRHGSWALWGVPVENDEAQGEPVLIQNGMEKASLLNWTAGGLSAWNIYEMNDIYLASVDPVDGGLESPPKLLEYTRTGANIAPCWSPDGTSLAFLSGDYKTLSAERDIIIIQGDSTRKFPVPAGFGSGIPKWSPDGESVGLLTADQENARVLLRLFPRTGTWKTISVPLEVMLRFDWNTDGSILLCRNGSASMGGGIIEYDLDTGTNRYVYRPEDTMNVMVFRSLDVSPDLKKALFLFPNTDLNMEVRILDLTTGEDSTVGTEMGYMCWSPDGERVLFDHAFDSRSPGKSLYIRSLTDGRTIEIGFADTLPVRSSVIAPDWSPDGRRIAFILRETVSEILLMQHVIPTQ
ncbi:PD40 domain-containing protein [bacterium]|nr:PD40 domain-containing protein [bacterium]